MTTAHAYAKRSIRNIRKAQRKVEKQMKAEGKQFSTDVSRFCLRITTRYKNRPGALVRRMITFWPDAARKAGLLG